MASILVIDDDRVIRRLVSESLRKAGGYQVTTARNGFEGLELAHEITPDLIICDVEMPELGGFDVVEVLQQDPATARIPFIFLTGHSDRNAMRQGMVLGADDFLSKPFKLPELLAAVKARLAKRERIENHYAEKLETLRENILMAVPHELRTPLSLIIGYGELLEHQVDSLPPDRVRSMANKIAKSGRRLFNLIENYIIYTQIELIMADQEWIESIRSVREAQPDYVVKAMVETLEQKYGRIAILNLNAADSILPISTENLSKIIEELVDNAFKFSPPDTAVSITTSIDDEKFKMSISNQGRGMTAKQIGYVGGYMQFGRKIHEQQGSGMGLIIAQRLTELHGGQVTIESEPDATTVITVILPV